MKKKVMLISPYATERLNGFPLGLAYLAGALREKYTVNVLDLTAKAAIENKNPEEILNIELRKHQPEIVGITSTSPTHKSALKIARKVKQQSNIPIIKGGPHETNCAETTIRNNPEIDYSVVGEGEETIVELAERIFSGKNVKGIRGIVYRKHRNVVNNGRRNLISNLDILPRPARDLFYLNEDFDRYYSAGLFEGKKSTSITTSRGCPYSCSFCSSRVNWGEADENGKIKSRLRQRSIVNVIEEIEELYSQGFRGLMFEDDMSIANKKWFLGFAKKIKEKGLSIEYTLQTRVNAIDKEVAKALSESGCKLMYFGVESGVQDILDICNKKITIAQAKKAFEIANKYGIKSIASIQFGLPGEDLDGLSTVRETIRVLNEELRPDAFFVSYTCLYPGSPLAIQEGVTPEMYEKYTKNRIEKMLCESTGHGPYSIHPKGLTPEKIIEIEELVKKESKIKRFEVNAFYNT
ncbi:B12-binding domain-containing radical SAM protein [Candidatus Woesearchaeota archaeon]|nr:B12-binding domain-containing radical SAM protein [Candidatus Woesearchaeota archaeon]